MSTLRNDNFFSDHCLIKPSSVQLIPWKEYQNGQEVLPLTVKAVFELLQSLFISFQRHIGSQMF